MRRQDVKKPPARSTFFFLYSFLFRFSSFFFSFQQQQKVRIRTYLPVFPFFLSWPSALLLFCFETKIELHIFIPNRWLAAIPIMKNLFAFSRPAFHFYPAGATRSLYLVGKKNEIIFSFFFSTRWSRWPETILHTHASIFFLFNALSFLFLLLKNSKKKLTGYNKAMKLIRHTSKWIIYSQRVFLFDQSNTSDNNQNLILVENFVWRPKCSMNSFFFFSLLVLGCTTRYIHHHYLDTYPQAILLYCR